MKKSNYNKNNRRLTKQENFKRNERISNVREMLKENEIFFKLISSILLAIMSLIVSWVGVKSNMRSENIYERQLEIMENDREPYFTIKCDLVGEGTGEEGLKFKKNLYTLSNKGGLITGAYILEVDTYVVIKVFNADLGKKITYILYLDDIFEKTEGIASFYDAENKEFKFYEYKNDNYDNLIRKLRSKLEETFPASDNTWAYKTEMYTENRVVIEYINYKNSEFHQTYQFMTGDRLILTTESETYKDAIFLDRASINENIDEVVDDVCFEISASIFNLSESKRLLKTYALSYDGLIDWLEKNGHSHENAVYAANNCNIDWNEEAVKAAKNYIHFEAQSYEKLLESLVSIEKFTYEQAAYGVNNCEVDWNEQAKFMAQKYRSLKDTYSHDELIELLESEGFSYEQAVYGVEQSEK